MVKVDDAFATSKFNSSNFATTGGWWRITEARFLATSDQYQGPILPTMSALWASESMRYSLATSITIHARYNSLGDCPTCLVGETNTNVCTADQRPIRKQVNILNQHIQIRSNRWIDLNLFGWLISCVRCLSADDPFWHRSYHQASTVYVSRGVYIAALH